MPELDKVRKIPVLEPTSEGIHARDLRISTVLAHELP